VHLTKQDKPQKLNKRDSIPKNNRQNFNKIPEGIEMQVNLERD